MRPALFLLCVLLGLSATCVSATLNLFQPAQVHIRIGMDNWVKVVPYKFGQTAALATTGRDPSTIPALFTNSTTKLKEAFGIDMSTFTPIGDGMYLSPDFRYTAVPIGFGDPYRLLFVRDGLGILRDVVSANDPPKVALYEYTLNLNNPSTIPAGTNYTGLYKGPVRAGDILANGIYTITQKPLLSFQKPVVVEMYMLSAIPGTSIGGIVMEHFRIWSPQYGSGIAAIQIITGDQVNEKGEFHVFIQNNFYFPAPDGVTAIPPMTN